MTTYMPDLSRAACATPDGRALFDDINPSTIPQARAICAECPVAQACLNWAVLHETSGMWGGHTEGQLDGIRRSRHIRLERLPNGWIVGAQYVKGARR